MINYFIMGVIFAFAAVVQPGPFQAYIISQSLSKGWRRTLPVALAPVISDIPIITLVLLILTHMPAWLTEALRIAGGVFLLYLGYGAFKTWRNYNFKEEVIIQSGTQSLLKAVTVNILNPNPYLGWSLVMGPLLIKGWHESFSYGVALITGFYGTMVVSTAGIIIIFAAAKNLGPKVNKILVAVSAFALVCFGIYELVLGISSAR